MNKEQFTLDDRILTLHKDYRIKNGNVWPKEGYSIECTQEELGFIRQYQPHLKNLKFGGMYLNTRLIEKK